MQRIFAMKRLKAAGFKIFASIEPIITFPNSLKMIKETVNHCDLYLIGLQKFKPYSEEVIKKFVFDVRDIVKPHQNVKVYFKDSINNIYPIRDIKHPQLVDMDYNIFKNR